MIARLACVLTLLLACAPAAAHELRPVLVQIQEQAAGQFAVQWKAPRSLPAAVQVVMPQGCDVRGEPLRLRQDDAVVTRGSYTCKNGIAGGRLQIDYAGSAQPAASVLVQASLADGRQLTHVIAAGERGWTLPQEERAGAVALDYLRLGVEHIWLGLDHLLFVGCLLFVARTPRRLLTTITGFTVAHSLTLVASTLGWVRVPVAPVEAAIALSILFLACEIARPRADSWTWRHPVLVSSSFGLLHGFGFAAVLQEIGLPQTQLPLALLTFNLGVEFGQLLFVAACVLAWAAVGRRPEGRPASALSGHAWAPIYAVGSLAGFWFIDRVAGAFT